MPPVRFNRESAASTGNPTRSTAFTANVAPLADPPLAIVMNESSEQTPIANNGKTFTSPSLSVSVATPAKKKLTLLGYQREAIDRIVHALNGGFTRVSVSAATGSGKTVTFLSMIKEIPKRGEGDKVLILVPTISIIRQIRGELRKWFRNVYEVDEEQGDKEPEDMSADIIIATWQSLSKRRIQKYEQGLFKCVIVDEAHRSVARTYLQQLHWFNDEVGMTRDLEPFARPFHGHKVPIIGFSGTMSRDDGKPLGLVYEDVVHHIGLETLSDQNVLAKIDYQPVWTQIKPLLDNVRQTYWMIAQKKGFLDLVVEVYLAQSERPKSTLVFCTRIGAAQYLTKQFLKRQVNAAYVDKDTGPSTRQEIDGNFKSGLISVLVNVKIYTEGVNIPGIDSVILASPTRARNTLCQMTGRGTRSCKGKTHCTLIDMFDVLKKAGHSVEPAISVEPCLWPEGYEEHMPAVGAQATDWDAW